MAPIEVIIFLGLFFAVISIAAGIYIYKKENNGSGLFAACFGVGISIAIIMWGIGRSNCMGGKSGYESKKMDYNNGKITYYTPKTLTATYCDEKYGFGYVIKYSILMSGLSSIILLGIEHAWTQKHGKKAEIISDETKSKLPKNCPYCNQPLQFSQSPGKAIRLSCINSDCLKYYEKFCPKCGNIVKDNVCTKCKFKE